MASATAVQPPSSTATDDGELSHKQILTILSGLMVGMFLASLDQTVVATAIRTIGDELNGLSVQAWVTTAFLITSTISTPLYGKLSDIYGRKPLYLMAITIFVLGSALCAFAQSMYMLAAFRAIQGIGAGGLMSLALAIIGDVIPPRRRAKYQGYMMAVFATSSVLGPVVGGFFAGQASFGGLSGWRWIFLINVPLGLVAFFVVNLVLHLPRRNIRQRIDWLGAATLIIALVPLLIIAEQGREWGWDSGRALLCYVVGVGGLVAFITCERRMGDSALLPLRLFRERTFAVGSAQCVIIGMAMFGGIAVLPLYLQIVHGASPTESGLLMLPLVGGLMTSSIVCGQITMRTGRYKIQPVIGTVLMVIGYVMLSQVGADTSLVYTDIGMLVVGLGVGANVQTLVMAMQNAVPVKDMGVATSSTTFFRQLGGTLGTAVFLSILFSTVGRNMTSAFQDAGTCTDRPAGPGSQRLVSTQDAPG